MLQGGIFLDNDSNELIVNTLCVYRIGNAVHYFCRGVRMGLSVHNAGPSFCGV